MKTIRIYILDDHVLIREGLAKLVSGEEGLEIAGCSGDSTQAINDIGRLEPEVVLVDISLREINGLDVIKTLRIRYPQVKAIVLSMHDEKVYAERALRAGARGYVMKQEASDAVVGAIRSVAEGEIYLSASMKNNLLGRLASSSGEGILPEERLSDRELEIFQLIGQGQPTRDIARNLGLSAKTIEAHKEHIKEKLCIANANELIKSAVEWVMQNTR